MQEVKQELWERMNRPHTIRMYANMIRGADIAIVHALYDNLFTHCKDHPKFKDLEPLFKERLGELE